MRRLPLTAAQQVAAASAAAAATAAAAVDWQPQLMGGKAGGKWVGK